MAVGGYTTAILVVHEHWRDVWTIPIAGLVAGFVGFLVGIPALRLSGLYLAIATFGLAVAMPSILKKFPGLTGGSQGLRFLESAPTQVTGLTGTVTIFGHSMTQSHFLYYLTWTIGLIGFAVAWLIVRGRLGRTFRAVRDSEIAAVSSGVSLARYKTLAFAISGVYAGVAGSLFAIQTEIVNPLSFTFLLSILILVGAVVGGLGVALGNGARRAVRPVPTDRLDAHLGAARSARFRLRRGDHPGHDPAPERSGRIHPAAGEAANNLVIHSSQSQMTRVSYVAAALLCALTLATVATGARNATPGVTSNEVVIGGTIPLTGVASAYRTVGLGAAAYFRYVNAHGGVNKRKIKYLIKDDAYDPGQTVDKTRELVEQDHVFAIFNSLGTEHNLATRAYLNARKVPQLFVASGATTWGRDYKQWPWTIGYQPNYRAEGTIYGRYVAKTSPKTRVGVLYQNDDYGKDLLTGLTRGLGKKAKLIVSKQSYDVTDSDVQSQIAKLKAAKVKTLMLFATPKFAIQSYVYASKLGWKPKVFVNAVASASNIMGLATAGTSKKQTEGSIAIVFLKDPTDPRWAKDKGMKLYRSIMKKYKGTTPKDVYNVFGMSVAHTFVEALKKAGKNPTQASIMKAVTHLNIKNDPFLLPGITCTRRRPTTSRSTRRGSSGTTTAAGFPLAASSESADTDRSFQTDALAEPARPENGIASDASGGLFRVR